MSVRYTCERCGAECVGYPQAKYCPTCRDEVIRQNQRERNQRRRRTGSPQGVRAPTLGQIAARARALHMSYGEFVAKYGI